MASQAMRSRSVALALLFAACSHRSGTSFKSQPTLYCHDCDHGKAPTMLSTYSPLKVTTLWYGQCWESEGGGWLPVPGDGDGEERVFPCKVVDHTPAIRCVGGGCTVTPVDPATAWAKHWPHGPSAPVGGNERYFEVVVTSPGTYQLEGQFVHGKGKKTEHLTLQVVRPTKLLDVTCRASESDATQALLDFTVAHPNVELASGPRTLALTAGGVACQQLDPTDDAPTPSYKFTCPVAAQGTLAITVTGKDFKLEDRADCK
jgi:hypothetical protein